MEKIFKAKRLGTGGWVFFNLSDSDFSSSSRGEFWVVCNGEVFNVDKNTICQYTGINDSKGNRIFEGDELDFDPVEWGGPHKFFIEWNDRDACFAGSGGPFDWPQWCTITGHNIHDRG